MIVKIGARRLITAVAITVALAAGAQHHAEAAQSTQERLALELYCDSNVYTVDQPIAILLILSNNQGTALSDVAPLSPEFGFCELTLEREPGGETVPMGRFAIYDTVFPTGGVTLPPGGCVVSADRLLQWYGSSTDLDETAKALGIRRRLHTGNYRVKATFGVHTQYSANRGIKQLVVESNTMRFTVVQNGPEDIRALAAIRKLAGTSEVPSEGLGPAKRMKVREALRWQLPQFTSSRFFHLVYGLGAFVGPQEPDLGLIDRRAHDGGGSVSCAWLLDDQVTRSRIPDEKKKGWVERAMATRKDRLERSVLRSWANLLAQRKGYTSFDE